METQEDLMRHACLLVVRKLLEISEIVIASTKRVI